MISPGLPVSGHTVPLMDGRSGIVLPVAGAVEHERPVRGQHEFGEHAGEAAPRLDHRHERAGGGIEPLERARPEQLGFAHEPVVAVVAEHTLGLADGVNAPARREDPRADLWFVEPQVEDGMVEFKGGLHDPGAAPDDREFVAGDGLGTVGPADGETCTAELAIDVDVDVGRPHGVGFDHRRRPERR